MSAIDPVAALRSLPSLAAAPDGPLQALAAAFEPLELRGRTFVQEGDAPDALYVLVAGQCEVFRTDESGERVLVGFLEPPEWVGLAGVLRRGQRVASVRARGPVQLLRLDDAKATALLEADDAVAAVLRRGLLASLARQLTRANQLYAALSGKGAGADTGSALVI